MTCRPLPLRITITNTAHAAAPALTPMMSGLASGLWARRWKIAPETPNAAPTSTAARPRGRRSVSTMNALSAAAAAEQRRHHVGDGQREVADRQPQANTTKPTATRATVTVTARASTRVDHPVPGGRTTSRPWAPAGPVAARSQLRQAAPADQHHEERRPDHGREDPDLHLAGPGDHAAHTSAPSSRIGARTIEYGSTQR